MKEQRSPESVELVRDFGWEERNHPTHIIQTRYLHFEITFSWESNKAQPSFRKCRILMQ
jgi:hypothetical protein